MFDERANNGVAVEEREEMNPLAGAESRRIDWTAVRRLLDAASREGKSNGQRLAIKTRGRVVFLDSGEIDWVEACGNYVRFHAGPDTYMARAGIGDMAEKLNPAEFVRVHRSTIVHIRKIRELQPCDNGESILTLKDGTRLSCSRSYSGWLQQLVKNCYFI